MSDASQRRTALPPPGGMPEATIDSAGRIKFPSVFFQYLKSLNQPYFFVTTLDEKKIHLYEPTVWAEIRNKLQEASEKPGGERQKRAVGQYARYGDDCLLDSQGRMVLPQEIRKKFKLANQRVRMWVFKNRIEIMPPDEYAELWAETAPADPAEDYQILTQAGFI